jgi:hypothetical protein
MSAAPTIVPVASKAEMARFIRLPQRLNANDPNFIMPLVMEREEALSPKVNPFFQHAEAQFFLAVRDGRDVGRISAQIDRLAPQEPGRPTGAFGLIAAEDDPAIFKALLGAAEDWLKARGMVAARGPLNLSVNEEVGLLVEGFDTPPMVMMGHDPAYTGGRIEEQGYTRAKDVYAYLNWLTPGNPMDRLLSRATRDPGRGVTLRPLDMKRYKAEVAMLTEILNDAWRDNWGFTPTTEEETHHLANAMRPLIDPRLIWFGEIDGEVAGVMVCLPNLNEAIAGLNGKLLPFGWVQLLWRLKVAKVKSLRIPLMGVKRKYAADRRGQMLPFQLIAKVAEAARRQKYERVEFSWILEDNWPMRKIAEGAHAERYKTYRIYEKALG